jgi:hypothetical protein
MITPKRAPLASIGKLIAAAEFQDLSKGFAVKFPEEVAAVFLPKQALLECIATYPGLSGISFRYGLSNVADPLSRKIIMVPCEHTTDGNGLPDLLLFRDGYVSSDGIKVSLDQFWDMAGNHVEHIYNGKHHFILSKVHRGYFWGINRLKTLLDLDECGGLIFHFGYNATHPNPLKRYQNILEVAGEDQQGRGIYMEYGQCDPPCVPEPPGGGVGDAGICIIQELTHRYGKKAEEHQLDILRAFRDDYMLEQTSGYALYEMYYYLSRPIYLAIQSLPDHEEIWHNLYRNELQQALTLIAAQKMEQVLALYKQIMQQLLYTYVLAKPVVLTGFSS